MRFEPRSRCEEAYFGRVGSGGLETRLDPNKDFLNVAPRLRKIKFKPEIFCHTFRVSRALRILKSLLSRTIHTPILGHGKANENSKYN